MRVGDKVLNDLNKKEGEIVAIINRNHAEKRVVDFTKPPILVGNLVIIYHTDSNEVSKAYDWEVTELKELTEEEKAQEKLDEVEMMKANTLD